MLFIITASPHEGDLPSFAGETIGWSFLLAKTVQTKDIVSHKDIVALLFAKINPHTAL